MEGMAKADRKKSLMFSVERLEKMAQRMDELSRLSEIMIDKFKRTEGNLKGDKQQLVNAPNPSIPDIIDLFDNATDRIEIYSNQIQNNIDRVIMMIE